MITILHNPRCSKSRAALSYLGDKGITPMIVKYLDTPLNHQELRQVLGKLGMKPMELIRKNEDYFKKEIKGKDFSDEELIGAMADHPKLMERPIIINGSKAVVGRPAEKIDEVL